MNPYRKFKLPEAARSPAKVANPAKVRTPEPETLATSATLAAKHAQTTNLGGKPTGGAPPDPYERIAATGAPPLEVQGREIAAENGTERLRAFWRELAGDERIRAGGRATLADWKAIAAETDTRRAADARNTKPAAVAEGPMPYADALARLQCQKPMGVSEAQWRLAISDARQFIKQWGKLAVQCGWADRDLFDPPLTKFGINGGLLWFTGGAACSALGPHQAAIGEGYLVFDRTTRQRWENPYPKAVN